jgi:hypothetical protein
MAKKPKTGRLAKPKPLSAKSTAAHFALAAEIFRNPHLLAAIMPPDFPGNWELADYGGDNVGHRESSPDPKACPGGMDWRVNNDAKFFNAKPVQADITALLNGIVAPTIGTCDGLCEAREVFRGDCWTLWRNKLTKQYYLYASKRVQWICSVNG